MCGLAGILCYGSGLSINALAKALAIQCTARGTDASGYAYSLKNRIIIRKRSVSAEKLCFKIPHAARSVIIHTRHATQGDEKKNINNHPWCGHVQKTDFALAHNGVLFNDSELRRQFPIPKTNIETDSYIALQLLEYQNRLDFKSLKFMAEQLQGSFSFSIMNNNGTIYLVKGDSPLSIIHIPHLKLYVYASTDIILFNALRAARIARYKYKVIKINQGDILKICTDGKLEHSSFNYSCETFPGSNWWDYSVGHIARNNEYVKDLKQAAAYMGFSPYDIDSLLDIGYTYDEIENYIYSKEENYK